MEKRIIVGDVEEIDGIRVVQDYGLIMEAIKNKETVYHWEWGNSLAPLINNGEFCKIEPCAPIDVKRGDAVFCVLYDKFAMVHLVLEISRCGYNGELWFKIGSTDGEVYGWTQDVYGIARGTNIFHTEVEGKKAYC